MSAATLLFPFPKGAAGVAAPGSWSLDQGVDIAAPANTPELAVGSGTIVREGISGFGPNAPVLKLDQPINGLDYVYYGHAGPDLVKVGQHVTAGQQITSVGAGIVGISTGPHLELGLSATPSPEPMNVTSPQLKQLLLTASRVSPAAGQAGHGTSLDPFPGGGDPLPGGSAPGGPSVGSMIGSVISGIFGGFFDYVKSNLIRAALFGALIFGGGGLAIYGLSHSLGPPKPPQ